MSKDAKERLFKPTLIVKKCEPEPHKFAAGDRVRFSARNILAALKHGPKRLDAAGEPPTTARM